jgi:drug/metabolite transporter (DMT)-like permease
MMIFMKSEFADTLGLIEVILAGVGFGFLGIFGRLAFQAGMTVGELLVFRFTLAAILLWIGLLVLKPQQLRLAPKQKGISFLLGIGGYAVFSTMYFNAIQGVSVAIAAMLLFTFPIFVNVGAHFFLKQRLGSKQWLSLAMAILGLALLLWGDWRIERASAIFWGLGAAITYAVYVLVSGELQRNVSPLSSSVYVITAAALALWLFHRPDWHRVVEFGWNEWTCVFGIAIVCTILPLTLFLSGLQKLSSSKAAIVVMIEPVTAAVAGWLILGERLALHQMIGAGVVIGALLINRQKKHRVGG